ncbi:hypothetical protein D3C83_70900 [compost metagenome]
MQPGPTRRIGRRQLVAGQIRDGDVELERGARAACVLDRERGRLGLEMLPRPADRGVELLWQCRHPELAAILVEDRQHERVAAEKDMLRECRSRLPEHGADRRFLD